LLRLLRSRLRYFWLGRRGLFSLKERWQGEHTPFHLLVIHSRLAMPIRIRRQGERRILVIS